MICPELGVLEAKAWATDVRQHVASCGSCKVVLELVDERSQAAASRDRRVECARFEGLIAVRVENELQGAAAAMLEAHLGECAECRAIAETLAPNDVPSDHETLPAIDANAYSLGLEVARGGMGRIIEGRDLRIGRQVAIKELLAKNAGLAARFEREARVTARLQHPGIVPIYEIGRWQNGMPFYAMRMVEGKTLRAAVLERDTLEKRLALLPSVIAAAEAVAFAHAHQVVHRDLTPANVMVGEYGETVVIDWGLAKDLSAETAEEPDVGPYRRDPLASADLTSAGAVIGTAAYMPPEQAAGERVDARADVYALGALLYHVLAGQAPYQGSAEKVLDAVRHQPPAPLQASAPRDLVSIVGKAMARDPSERYPTAKELAAELTAFQTGRIVEAHRYSYGERLGRWVRARRVTVIASAAALIAILVVGTIGVAGVMRERDRAESERDAAEVHRGRSEQERLRADQLAIGLLEDRGRRELLDGNRERAAAYLSAAYTRGADSPALRYMLADSMTAFDGELATVRFHGATEAMFDHSGRRILVTRNGEQAAIFEVSTGSLVSELKGLPLDENRLEFSPDDVTLFGRRKNTLLQWDVKTGRLIRSVVAHRGSFTLTPPYAGGRLVATLGDDGVLKIWDAATLTVVVEQPSPHKGDAELLLAPNDRYLVSVPFEGNAAVLDAQTGRRMRDLSGNTGRLLGFTNNHAFSPDGRRVVLGDIGGTVTIWDLDSGKSTISLRGHGVPAMASFDPAGTRIVVFDFRRDAYVADAATGTTLTRFHGEGMVFFGRFSADSNRLITARISTPTSGRVDILDAASGGVLQRIEGRILKAAQLGDRIAIGSLDVVRIINTNGGRLVGSKMTGLEPYRAGFVQDGHHIFVDVDKTQSVWDPATNKTSALAPDPDLLDTTSDGSRQVVRIGGAVELRRNDGGVLAKFQDVETAQLTPDDRRIVVADRGGSVQFVDPTTGQRVAAFPGTGAKLGSVACSRNGRCVTLDSAGTLRVVTEDGSPVASCRPGEGSAVRAVLSRVGTRVVVMLRSSDSWQPALIDVDGCREIARLGTPGKSPDTAIEFAGTRVLVDHTVWDANDGKRVADLPNTPDEIKLLFALDGEHVARVSWYDTKIWTLTSPTLTERRVERAICDGRFSTDGALFFAAVVEGGIDVVETETGRVVAHDTLPAAGLVLSGRDLVSKNFLVDVSESEQRLMSAGPDGAVRVWSISRETRSPDSIARIVAARTRWRLDGSRLVWREAEIEVPSR